MTPRLVDHVFRNQVESSFGVLSDDPESVFGRVHLEAVEVESHDVQNLVHDQVDVSAVVPVGQFDPDRVHCDVPRDRPFGRFFFGLNFGVSLRIKQRAA